MYIRLRFFYLALSLTTLLPLTLWAAQAPPREARKAFNQGLRALEQGNFVEAASMLTQSLEHSPTWGFAYLQLAKTYQNLSADSKALEALKKALKYSPNDARVHLQLGLFYKTTGNCARALPRFQKALKLRPSLEQARFEQGLCHETTNNRKLAIERFEEIVEDNPKHLGAWAALGRLHEQAGDQTQAENAHRKMIELYPNVPFYQIQLIQFFKRMGNIEKAIKIREAIKSTQPAINKTMRELPRSKELN